jgi:hypothetical protein
MQEEFICCRPRHAEARHLPEQVVHVPWKPDYRIINRPGYECIFGTYEGGGLVIASCAWVNFLGRAALRALGEFHKAPAMSRHRKRAGSVALAKSARQSKCASLPLVVTDWPDRFRFC